MSHDIWEKAQKRLEANKHTYLKPRKNFYLLSGKLNCEKCGLCGVGYTSKSGSKIYQYYRCDGRYAQTRISHRCDLPLYRADHVDATVWGWIKSLLCDPEALALGLEGFQVKREAQIQPLRDRLTIVDDLLAENKDQLARLLDLYLSGEFPKEELAKRRAKLEDEKRSRHVERTNLQEQIYSENITEEQVQDLLEFSTQVRDRLASADNDNQLKRQLLEALDLRVTLAQEDDQKIIFIRCIVGESVCTVSNTTNGECPNGIDRRLFEDLVLDGAQAGLSWMTILRKRENYQEAFDNFDPAKVAAYDEAKIEELLGNVGIVRNRQKINSAIKNAKAFLKVQEEFGTFEAYIWGFVDGRPIQNAWQTMSQLPAKTELSETISKDLKKRGFSFVGPTIIYAFMQAVGMVNDHTVDCFRYHEVAVMS